MWRKLQVYQCSLGTKPHSTQLVHKLDVEVKWRTGNDNLHSWTKLSQILRGCLEQRQAVNTLWILSLFLLWKTDHTQTCCFKNYLKLAMEVRGAPDPSHNATTKSCRDKFVQTRTSLEGEGLRDGMGPFQHEQVGSGEQDWLMLSTAKEGKWDLWLWPNHHNS